jgi:hypothetical protein
VILERREPGDRLALDLEGGDAVRDALLGLGEGVENPVAQQAERAALRLLERRQVPVDVVSRHGSIVLAGHPDEQECRHSGERAQPRPQPTAAGAGRATA